MTAEVTRAGAEVRVEISHAPTLNFAMEQAGVPIVSGVRIFNGGAATIDNAELFIAIEPNVVESRAHAVGRIRAGSSIDLPALDLQLRPGRLRQVVEAERAELVWELLGPDGRIAVGRSPIDVLAFNEWPGLRAPPALLATYVTPNDPVVPGVLRRVRDRLRATTGDGAITGYQTRSAERVRAMVRALYETMQGLGVSYIGAPASFEEVGQKIRFVERVLRESLGNCLDVSVLVASCLEQMGISPLIIIQRGHAFPAAWLVDERFHECVVYDVARLRNASALGQILFFDSSAMVQDPAQSLEASERIANNALSADADFLCAVDIVVARRDRYRPLPLRDPFQRATTTATGSETARSILDEASRLEDSGTNGAEEGQSDCANSGPPRVSAPPAEPAEPAVALRFRKWREKLLDLSLRNKLLNFRRDVKGALPLDVPEIARFEDLLAAEQTFDLHPRPTDARDERDAALVRGHGGDEARREGLVRDLGKGILHCPLDETAMLRHAIHLDREARTAMEEGGANVLYIAIGLLKWFESPSSTTERLAPLLLVPVALEYVRTTRRIRLRHLAEESLPNWTLVEKMRADFGVELTALANIEPDESGLDVPAMLHGVREAIQRRERWEVLEEAHLGLFSFTKYLMWRDLVDNADVLLKNEVVRHIATKKSESFRATGEAVSRERLDDDVHPKDLPLVVDADSTQTTAVVAALRGRSFVLQGPPGTGKSQTITNLIAAALAAGKTVLFVSEKMAALEVVYRRLQSVGLGDFCLELHSHKAHKREVVQSLGRTLDRSERVRRPRWEETSAELAALRGKLNSYVRALHAPTALGWTFQEANARLLTLAGAPPVSITLSDANNISRDQFRHALARASEFGLIASQVEPAAAHPFRACCVDGWSAQRDEEARAALATALESISELVAARADFCSALNVGAHVGIPVLKELAELTAMISDGPVPTAWRDDAEWKELRDRVAALKDAREDQAGRRADLARRWNAEFFAVEIAELEPLFAKWATAFFLFAWLFLLGARRRLATSATSSLPGNRQIAVDLARARQTNEAETALSQAHRTLRRAFDGCGSLDTPEDFDAILARGEALRAAMRKATSRTNVKLDRAVALADTGTTADERRLFQTKAARALSALGKHAAAIARVRQVFALPEDFWSEDNEAHLDSTLTLLQQWTAQMSAFRPWCLYQRACHELRAAGFGALVDAHASGALRGDACESALERAILSSWIATKRDATPVLRDFDGKSHHATVARFRVSDRAHVVDARARVAALLEERLPRGSSDASAASEPGILRREMARKRGHQPLRKLLQQMPNLLVRLKPCLLMSPLSVAQYLPATGRKFDLVVFDEASQICTHDAIGAIGRGDQVVVVGDSKQLPPTAFFQRTANDDAVPDENDFTELESILDEALASGLPEQMLGWHYRSRHEALIEFSNNHYYDSRLNVFPAARGRVPDLGVKFHYVENGIYEAGRSRTNPREARALVDLLVRLLRETRPAERTFGIVTFSAAQQEHVENLLDDARKQYPEIEHHFSDDHPKFEKVFVKNLENVQGDERDEVFFSVAYGPDEHDKMLMNFGPLNREGGERRLNVAVTRARKQLRVFTSITADRIDTNRTRSTGARHLKAFLRFAKERDASSMSRANEASGDFDSDFERDVYDVLRASGHRVDTQVGCGAYKIDLAVVHPQEPGVYAIGVECDGAAYHSGATARDRDRLRQEVLEGLGWRLHRIWSTDWIYNRAKEIDRLLEAIEAAVREAPRPAEPSASQVVAPPSPPPSATPDDASTGATTDGFVPDEWIEDDDSPVVPYQRAELAVVCDDPEAMHDPNRTTALRALVVEVVRVEAPIHVDELARRVGAAFGAQRVTGRARRRILEALRQTPGCSVVDDFVWAEGAPRGFDIEVRVGRERDPETVPAEEIAAAAKWVLSRSLSMPLEDLVRSTARVFGIQRVGARVESRMRIGIELLMRGQLCTRDGERVVWKGDSQR